MDRSGSGQQRIDDRPWALRRQLSPQIYDRCVDAKHAIAETEFESIHP